MRFFYRLLVKSLLCLNTWSYKMAGVFSQKIEKDGLHPKHRILKYHEWYRSKISPDWAILDVGCGNGALTYDLAQKAQKVIGIDINPKNIHKAKEKFSSDNLVYITGDVTEYDFKEHFDAVTLSNVYEHIEYRIDFLKKLASLSDRLIIRVPQYSHSWIVQYKKELGLDWRLDNTHFIEYTPEILEDELKEAGFRLESMMCNWGEIYCVAVKNGQ